MATYRGLFMRLKDKHTSVEDKLKLAKFAWGNDAVVIPNKFQQLLDYLCGLLVNKKKHKIALEDEIAIWKTVKRFLIVSQSKIPVKASIIQVITEALLLQVKSDINTLANSDLLSSVIAAALLLLEIPSIKDSHFENQCQLLSVICQLHLKLSSSQRKQCDASSLLKSTVKVVTKSQSRHSNQIQVFTSTNEKLLVHAFKCQQKYFSSELQDFFLSYLLHGDHQDSFMAFLKHEEEQTETWSKPAPKYITAFFSSLATQRISYVATSLLPAFVQRFVQLNKLEPRSCFLLLKYVLTVSLGLDVAQTSLPSSLTADEWMTCLAGCCRVCKDCDLIAANSDQNDITKWFCQLTELVLPQQRNSAWFDYMTSLLSLSPLVVEKYLLTILQHSLTDSLQVSAGCIKDQDIFLSELLSFYLKLRRAQDFINTLISAVDLKVSGLHLICALTDFHKKLNEMFNEVPMMTLTMIWEKILQSAVDSVSSDLEPFEKLSFKFMLLTSLLNYAKIFGHRSMGIAGHRVQLLMSQMEENLLLPLSKKKITRKSSPFKELLNVWASAKMLFNPKWRELPQEEEGKQDNLDPNKFDKLYQRIDLPFRVRLRLQRPNITKAENDFDMSDITDSRNTIQELLEFPPLTKQIVFAPWNQESEDKNLAQGIIDKFKQLTSVFPLIGCNLDHKAMDECATLIVQVMSYQSTDDLDRLHTKGTSLYQEVSKFLKHPATREVKALQNFIVAKTWDKLLSVIDQQSVSPKKKKKRESENLIACSDIENLYQFLTTSEEKMPDITINLDKVSEVISIRRDQAEPLIQMLLSLDLECIRFINLKCQIGFLIMSACLKNDFSAAGVILLELVERGLVQCLSVLNLSDFFKLIKPGVFFTYIIECCSQKLDERQTLPSCAVFGIMNDRSAVLSLPPVMKKLVTDLREKDGGNLPSATKIQICALVIRNCSRYISTNFHIQEVASAAMDIFCTLSKFTIKHSLEWLDRGQPSLKKDPVKLQRKRKSVPELSPGSRSHEDTNSDLWCANLNCFSEVLHLWTDDISDERISQLLCSSVEVIHKKILTDLSLNGETDEKTKVTQLMFLEACCHCHRRLMQGRASMSANTSLRPLLNEDIIAQTWSSCITLCQSELFSHVSKTHALHVNNAGSDNFFCIDDWQSWPSVVNGCLDVLTSVMECVPQTKFAHYFKSMMGMLTPDKSMNFPAIFVVMSVWRRLIQSTLIPETSVKEIFAHIYEFFSSSLSLLQHLECLKQIALEEIPKSTAPKDKDQETTSSLPENSKDLLRPHIWIPNVSRFLLHAMADFIDLAKVIITPRTILLCLQAATSFAVTCTEDFEALQRLVNTFVVHHPMVAIRSAATLISLVSKLICSCVSLGFSEVLTTKPQQEGKVVHCAELVTRVLIVLASGDYKKELGKVAHCALADYIVEVQKGTLHMSVKKELVRGLYRLMSICDKYRLASLYTSLHPGVKDTFKFMHQDYEKYYRYKGNV